MQADSIAVRRRLEHTHRMMNDSDDRGGQGMIESSVEVSSIDDLDRNAIRKGRKAAAKKAKRIVGKRYDDVIGARPPGSRPGDQMLAAAVALYDDGPIMRRDLKSLIANLESNIRRSLPDLTVIRAPRSASSQPEHVGLMVYETRAVTEHTDRIVTAENHSVVLTEARVIFISGLLPGGTRPHLFERVVERDPGRLSMSAVLLQLSAIWPTLLGMRMKQRREGRGLPVTEVITPFANGLLFGNLEKLDGLPPAGPTVVEWGWPAQQTRQAHDFYAEANGTRLWARTNTFVDGTLLAPDQQRLRNMLQSFLSDFPDIVADNNWRWRFGFGTSDPAVAIVAKTFKISEPSQERRAAALAALEAIVATEVWKSVTARSLESRSRSAVRSASAVTVSA